MTQIRKLWRGLRALLLASFSVLLWMGGEVHRLAPPMPDVVKSADGTQIFTRSDTETG
jgi:nitric oxide reductase subunit B